MADFRSFAISWRRDGVLLAAALLVALLGRPVRRRVVEPYCFPCDEETVNPLDREVVRWHSRSLDALSYAVEIAALATPVLSSFRAHGPSRYLLKDMLVYGETVAVNSAANMAVKMLAARPVPRVYTGLFPELQREARGYGSFYSGHCAHTTGALAANAEMDSLRGGKKVRPWVLLAGGATLISVARVGAGRHFYTDVVAGSLAGAVIGVLVPRLHPKDGGVKPVGAAGTAAVRPTGKVQPGRTSLAGQRKATARFPAM